jgi:hypothetical protein
VEQACISAIPTGTSSSSRRQGCGKFIEYCIRKRQLFFRAAETSLANAGDQQLALTRSSRQFAAMIVSIASRRFG